MPSRKTFTVSRPPLQPGCEPSLDKGSVKGAAKRPGTALLAAGAALLLSLAGCGGEETAADGTSPNHMIKAPKPQGKYRYGITDTLVMDFSEPIDTAALDLRFTDSAGVGYAFRGRKQALLFGTKKTFNTGHFPVNTSFTMSMLGLRDDAGNGTSAIEETFQPYRWADRDFLDGSFRGYDSLFSGDSTWIDGSPLRDTLIVEGALDFNENTGLEDRVDMKVVRLSAPDTLDIVVSALHGLPLNLQLGGPFKAEELDTALANAANFPKPGVSSVNGKLSASLRADYQEHDVKLGSPSAPGLYALRISLPTVDTEGFYRVQLKLRKLKK